MLCKPLLMSTNVVQSFFERSVISFLSVIGGSPGMPVQNIAIRYVIVSNDYPVMASEFTVDRDIVIVDLNDTIRRLPETCNIRIGEHRVPSV